MRTPTVRYEEARKLINSIFKTNVATYHYNGRYDIIKCPSTGECRVCNLPLSYIVRFRERTVSLRCKNTTCHVSSKNYSFDGTEVAPSSNATQCLSEKRDVRNCSLSTDEMFMAMVEGGMMLATVIANQSEGLHVYTQNGWYVFKEHRWVSDQEAIHGYFISSTTRIFTNWVDNHGEQEFTVPLLTKLLSDINKRVYREALVKDLTITLRDNDFLSTLDSNKRLLGFKNGVFDFEDGTFRIGHPSDRVSLSTGRDFVPLSLYRSCLNSALTFIADVIPDTCTRDLVLLSTVAALCGHDLSRFFLWVGHGSNGKSKLANFMRMCFGEYTCSIPVSLFTNKRGVSSAAAPELTRTRGRRVAFISEPSHNETLNMGIVKELTGGDPVYVRELYKNGSEFTPSFLPILLCNVLPSVTDTSHGAWRRIITIDFKTTFTENPKLPNEKFLNPHIHSDMENWADVFATYMCVGMGERWRDSPTLIIPKECAIFNKQYQEDSDFYAEYYSEKVSNTSVETDIIEWSHMWTDFYRWFCVSYGKEHVPKKSEAKKKFQSDIFKRRLKHGKWNYCLLH
jgi:P4 family phage/plasmid primase-like protien